METGTILDSEVDRLSSLPADLLYKILSYVDIIYSIRLSVLSSRLRFIWTLMPNLSFSSHEVYRISSRYNEFVNYVLSARDNKVDDVSSVSLKLSYYEENHLENPELSLERILEYAFSHNVQQLSIIGNLIFSPSQLSSKSLEHLTMIGTTLDCRSYSPWDFPALSTLYLHYVKLNNYSCILAMCQNLKNLTLDRCEVVESDYYDGFTINNSRLLSLTLKKVEWNVKLLYVDTPQLKNLTFVGKPPPDYYDSRRYREFPLKLTISACDLTCLRIKGSYFPNLSSDGFHSLEKVDFCITSPQKTDVHNIRYLFQRLHNVKSLSLSLEIVELLSTLEEVISHQRSPFPSLKSLKIYPLKGLKALTSRYLKTYRLKTSLDMFRTHLDMEHEAMKLKLSADVTEYLLDSSSNTTFTIVSHEEARATKITKAAYRLMAALWDIVENVEAYFDKKTANVEGKKTADGLKLETRRWGDSEVMLCMLQNIKVLLTKVLASKRVEMQARLSRLSAKTRTLVNKIVVDMKNQCDRKQNIFSEYFDEIDLAS